MKIKKVCQHCGKEYFVHPYRSLISVYCSHSCRAKGQTGTQAHRWNGGQIKKICRNCQKEFRIFPSESAQVFCSMKCKSEYSVGENAIHWKGGQIEKTCAKCGESFFVDRHRKDDARFCSRSCAASTQVGENGAHWQGGKSFEPYPPTFNEPFKRMIRERDNYTCAVCKQYGNYVHHINYVKNDTVPENCITLCCSCHSKTNANHKYWVGLFSLMVSEKSKNKCD